MKYNCNVIKDLIPLYNDNVASDESVQAIKEHLTECDDCRNYSAACRQGLQVMDAQVLSDKENETIGQVLSYKKRIRKHVKRLILLLAMVSVAVALLFVGIVARLTVFANQYSTSDIAEYGNYDGHIASERSELIGTKSRLLIFPKEITPQHTVNNYFYKCASVGLENGYQMVLDYSLPAPEFKSEVERLSKIDLANAVIYDTVNFNYPAFVTIFNKFSAREYALIDEENNRIICILSCGGLKLEKLPIDTLYLPFGEQGYEKYGGQRGFSVYQLDITSDGRLIAKGQSQEND